MSSEALEAIATRALDACAAVIADTADHGPAVALERLADKLNAWDAVQPEDVANYERAMARLAPITGPKESA